MDRYIRFNRHIVRPYIWIVLLWLFPVANISTRSQLLLLVPLLIPIVLSTLYLYNDIKIFNPISVIVQSTIRLVFVVAMILKVNSVMRLENIDDYNTLIFNIIFVPLVLYDTIILDIELITDTTKSEDERLLGSSEATDN